MSLERYLFTSESVTEGHPDKIADQISDSILDAILTKDPEGRVAVETLVTTGLVVVAGEIGTNAYIDIPKIARETINKAGYTRAKYGFDGDTCAVVTTIDEQSPDIAQGVDKSIEIRTGQSQEDELDLIGAGDQGLVFGYATNETAEYLPLPIVLAHRLTKRLADARKNNIIPYLRPDGKSQVTVEYENGKPIRVDTIVISTQHDPEVDLETINKVMG
jgi:S-adenosylmethionine synthetase